MSNKNFFKRLIYISFAVFISITSYIYFVSSGKQTLQVNAGPLTNKVIIVDARPWTAR